VSEVHHSSPSRGAAVILAAGASSRMGTPKALLTHPDGRTLLRALCETLAEARLAPLVVVLGHHRALLERELQAIQTAVCLPRPVTNPQPERGQVSSLACGLAALAGEAPFALVALVDQPGIPRPVLEALLAAAAREATALHVPVCRGVRGHPAIFPTSLAGALDAALPDESAREVIARVGVRVREHAVEDKAVLLDLDTPEDLAAWREGAAR
jgi:molybdenum cofactor cytidylyltransferase